MSNFIVYPAIDLRAGNVVRLRQGDYADETIYGDDPVSVAASFVDAGAQWVHMVDLDAAKGGDAINRPVIAAVVKALQGRAFVQVGGGVRSVADAEALQALGVQRVVMGSAAVRTPQLVEEVTQRVGVEVAVGLDHRGGFLATDGWTTTSSVALSEALHWYPTASCAVVTDISRDGMLSGSDVEGLLAAGAISPLPLIASGGIGTLSDISALLNITGVSGVITGKAIYENRFTVAEAIAAANAGRQ